MIESLVFLVDLVFTVFWLFAAIGLIIPFVGDKYTEIYTKVRFKGLKNEKSTI